MKTLAATLLLFLALNTNARADVQPDLVAHFVACAAITEISYIFTDDLKTSVLIGLGAGAAREIYKLKHGAANVDLEDALAGTAGVAAMGFSIQVAF